MSARDTRAGGAYVEVFAHTTKAEQALTRVANRLKAFGAQTMTIGRNMVLGGSLAAAGLVPVISTLSSFEDKVSAVAAVTGASANDLDQLRAKAKELGATTSFSASQVAEAMGFLGMAGFKTEQILQSIPDLLNLARAGMIELGPAADIASDVGSAFGLSADQIGRVADVMAKTASSANTNIEMLGETFKYSAPLAAAAGQEIETTAAAAGQLGNNGIKASMAGTDLALILKTLADPAARKNIEELGVAVIDDAGNVRNLVDVMADLDKALVGMTSADRLAFMASTFSRAAKSAQILSSQSDQLRELENTIRGSGGAAAEMATTMDDNVGGKIRAMLSALEGSMIQLGETLTPALKPLIDDVIEFLGQSSEWISQNEELVLLLVKVVGGLTAFGGALMVAGMAISAGGTLVAGLSTGIGVLSTVLASATALATGFSVALGAMAIVGLVMLVDQLADKVSGLNDEFERSDRLAGKLNDRTYKKQRETLAKAETFSDPKAKRGFLARELQQAKKELQGYQASVKGAEKEVDRLGTTWNRAVGNDVLKVAEKELDDTRRRLDITANYVDTLQEKLDALNPDGKSSNALPMANAIDVLDDPAAAVPELDPKKLEQTSFVDRVLESIQTPEEQFEEFAGQLFDAMERGDISGAQYDRAYSLKRSELLGDGKNQELELFADQVKSQVDPLADFEKRMQQLNEAVDAGLLSAADADKFQQSEADQLARSLDLDKVGQEGTNKANRAVELGTAEGLNALIDAAFNPGNNGEQKTIQKLGQLLGALGDGNTTLAQIKQVLQNGEAPKTTNWSGGGGATS